MNIILLTVLLVYLTNGRIEHNRHIPANEKQLPSHPKSQKDQSGISRPMIFVQVLLCRPALEFWQ